MWKLLAFVISGLFFTPLNGQILSPVSDSVKPGTIGVIEAEPAGYYDAATGLSCAPLKSALRSIITTGMTPMTYGNLWTQYLISDIKPREVGPGTSANVIWDIYSDNPTGTDPYNFTPGPVSTGGQQDNGTAVSGEGELYNREHSVPQSWFGANASPSSIGPESDYFHVFPTDKEVNSNRGNFIYGVVNTPTILSANGGKLGANTWPGLTGISFEPINEYKGDLARAFLYFVTRYENNMASWEALNTEGDKAFDGTTWPSVELPYLKLMLQWHNTDLVSPKETARNDAGYIFQGNRNPYVDHPEFVGQIWSTSCGLLLPVDIINFTADYQQNTVLLNWTIDRADGLKNFEIERSVDGGITYQYAGTVSWVNGVNDYYFTDNVSAFDGTVLYRLKVIDQNLVYKYSKTLTVKLPARFDLMVLYPNPVADRLNVSFRTNNTNYWKVSVVDFTGRVLQRAEWKPGSYQYTVPVFTLKAGAYILQLQSNEQTKHLSFVVQR
jgi:endonuclease I